MSTSPHNNGNLSPKLNNHMILAVNFPRSTLSSTPTLWVHLQDKTHKQQARVQLFFYLENARWPKRKGAPHPCTCEWEPVMSARTATSHLCLLFPHAWQRPRCALEFTPHIHIWCFLTEAGFRPFPSQVTLCIYCDTVCLLCFDDFWYVYCTCLHKQTLVEPIASIWFAVKEGVHPSFFRRS